jgi:hypothetical protein
MGARLAQLQNYFVCSNPQNLIYRIAVNVVVSVVAVPAYLG